MAQYGSQSSEGLSTTVTTDGTAVIVGTDTLWVTSTLVVAGNLFTIDGVNYEIGSVDTETQLTLTSIFAGPDASGQIYTISSQFTTNHSLPYSEKGDVETAALNKRAMQNIDTVLANIDSDGNITGGTAILESLQLSGGTGTQGTLTWNTDEETLDLVNNDAILQIGQEMYFHVRNNSGNPIPDGTPVMATGTIGASGRITIGLMDGTDSANAKFYLGITTESIADGDDGKITTFGKVRGIDTTGAPYGETWAEGNVIWISPTTAGYLTNVEPISGLALPIAFVITGHATTGTLMSRANNEDQSSILIGKTLTSPDINGGTADDLTSLSVAADSDGNVSRHVMTTAVGAAGDSGYWAKLATITPSATDYQYVGFSFIIQDGFQGQFNSTAKVSVFLTQNTAGLHTDSDLHVSSIDGGSRLSHDSFKLVAAAANGSDVELWVRKDATYGRFTVYELSKSNEQTPWTFVYNNGATWQSAAPTGAVEITSDWALNAGVVESGSNANGEYVMFADGTMICTKNITSYTTDAAGAVVTPFPATFISPPATIPPPGWSVGDNAVPANTRIGTVRVPGQTSGTSWQFWVHRVDTGARMSSTTESCDVNLTAIGKWK